jgi:AcrR family transcriptional regulator
VPRRSSPTSARSPAPAVRSPSPASPERTAERRDINGTRERILDIALDLFIEQGYEKTSLRQIAEELGFSKAALYYHFASKDEILLALHLRLHDLSRAAFARLDSAPATAADWGALLQELVGDMLANRKLLVLHERNHGAFEMIGVNHPDHHGQDHQDFEASFRRMLADEQVPIGDRVRLVCALGAVVAGLLLYSNAFSATPVEEYEGILRQVVADLFPAA